MKIDIRVFYKLVVSILLVIAQHVWSTQNSKFEISLQYLKREERHGVGFLNADKDQTILLIYTTILLN